MMRKASFALGVAVLAAALLAFPAAGGEGNDGGAPEANPHHGILVDDLRDDCPTAQYTSIQAAVLASPAGSTIQVCPGVYNEQVVIPKPMRIIGVAVDNKDQAIVKPLAAVANTTSTASGNPIAAIMLAKNAKDVDIENLTVDGISGGITGCAPNYVGIMYQNASGEIQHNAVRNIKLGPGLTGCQSGLAIFVQSGGTVPGGKPGSRVEIDGNSVHDYQKNGITGNEDGTIAWIHDNTVSGNGIVMDNAQNGIQLAYGARGSVWGNSVIDHVYGQCTDVNTCAFTASNILFYNAVSPEAHDNTLGNSQANVYQQGDKAKIDDNTIFQSRVFDGIDLVGNSNEAEGNTIMNSDEAAVFIDGNGNHVNGNLINEAPIGILGTTTSNGNHLEGNRFYNVALKYVPPTLSTSGMHAASAKAGHDASPAQP